MKTLIISCFLMTFLLPLSSVAQVVSSQEISEMSYNKLQKLRYSYIEFLMKVENDQEKGLLPSTKSKTTSFQHFWNNLLISHAYAKAEDGSLCFFGGWPSRMSHGKCSRPWTQREDEDVKKLGAYNQSNVCGGATKFRCNPVLFGTKETDGKGVCIDTDGTFNHLTEKCERASRALVPKVIESYQENPELIHELGLEIKKFCDSYESYDSCDDLARRIREITGEGIGTYSGKGNGPEVTPEPVRVGGRTRNVNVVGEHLRPGGDMEIKAPDTGAQVLNRCQKLLKDKPDVQNRNILGVMKSKECSEEIGNTLSSLSEVEKIAQRLNKQNVVSEINAKAFEQNILAILANEIRFGTQELDLADKNGLYHFLVKNSPHLKNDPRYKEAFLRAYDNLDREAKAGRLYPFEPESTRIQFNHLASMVNDACSKIRDGYVKKFGDPGLLTRFMDSDEHEAFFKKEASGVHREMDMLLGESVIGHLLSTDYFKKNVFDPSDEFVEECARNPSYQVMKQPVAASTIRTGHNQVMAMMRGNLQKLDEREKDLNSRDQEKAEEILADYLKTDSGIVGMTMDDLDSQEQYGLGVLICQKTNEILTSDKNWRYADMAIGGVGIAAGVVLMATGVGSPLGVALTAASIGMAGYQGARAVNQYRSSSASQRAADLALAQRRQRMEDYLNQSDAARSGKKAALIQGGLAAVSAFPAVKVLSNSLRTSRSTALVVQGKNGSQVATQGSRAVTKTPPPRAPSGFSGTTSSALKTRPWSTLSFAEREIVRKEAQALIRSRGVLNFPSKLLGGKNINQLNLKESEELLRKLTSSNSNKEAYRKMSQILHPDKNLNQPRAIKELLEEEFKLLGLLKSHIQKLGGKF